MTNETPIGGWSLYCDLRSSEDPKRLHTVEEVAAVLRTWSNMRTFRKDLIFPKVTVTKLAQAELLCIIHGVSEWDREKTMQILQELVLCIGDVLKRSTFHLHIGGDFLTLERKKIDRPANILLN